MAKYIVHMTQNGYGRLYAQVSVEAQNEEDAREIAYESDITWKVQKFSGEGYEIEEVEEVKE